MAQMRVRLSAPVAAGVIAAIFAGWWLTKPEPFRRDVLTELRGVSMIAATYEARYRDCADERWEIQGDLRGFALGFVGRWTHRFPADDDADAVAFARAALPDCTLYRLDRKKRFYVGVRNGQRSRVGVDLSQY